MHKQLYTTHTKIYEHLLAVREGMDLLQDT